MASIIGQRVLVLEHDHLQAQHIATQLMHAGARVLGPVPTPEAALTLVREEKPDAAILDIHLCEGTAYPVADLLVSGGVPFLFAAGHDHRTIPERFADIRVFDKSHNGASLLEALVRELKKDRVTMAADVSYSVRRVGGVWQWQVKRYGVAVESGCASSLVLARAAAILSATKRLH
jgi:DNA-binding NarL/FixJ family response regulator